MRNSRPKPTSIKDIARMASVSHSTVSRALQNSSLVNRKTAEKIQRIARQSGYRVSAVARGLVTQKTRTVGVVVTAIADPFVSEVVSGIEEAANRHGYSVFLAQSNAEPDREIKVVHSFAERRVDGIVVTSSRVGSLHLQLLSKMKVPIVLVNNQHPGEAVHSVMIQNVEASRQVTQHLIRLGHRRIAYIGDRFGYQSDTERLAGYREALEQASLTFLEELAVQGDGKPEGGMAAMRVLLGLAQPPTAVFCYNDMTALGALRCLHSDGLRVPQDISLVGFDDLFIASYTQPPLTTVRQPRRQMGLLAMEILLKLMSGQDSADTTEVPAELIVRESTAPPGRS
ncbi:MAG: LacI family DNA-binding transcriptional regulator [Terriglobia bacterium]